MIGLLRTVLIRNQASGSKTLPGPIPYLSECLTDSSGI